MIHAYARVSTDGQSVEAQVRQLRAAGARKVWRETASGQASATILPPQATVFGEAGVWYKITSKGAASA